ncbi:MAG TPA: type IV secretion system protein, partial [Candidatus Saccharimonadia bacterium]|nr:type IV secretion system protein [Candidatus Saccharimonadia bacterium]
MSAQLLNDIVRAFVAALEAGTGTLGQYSFGLLAIAATLAFYFQVGPQVASGGTGVGDALAGFVLLAIKIGVISWLVLYLPDLARAAFDTFAQWGSAVSRGGFTRQNFVSPAEIVDTGFRMARPVRDFTSNILNFFSNDLGTLLAYQVAYYAIIIGFFVVALHVMMVIIEFNLAVLVATVLFPWAVFPALAFYGDFVVAWLTGALVRVLLTAAMVSIGLPLFHDLKFTLSSGGDPTFYSGLLVGGTAVMFAILSWVLPSRAAAIAGRGVS